MLRIDVNKPQRNGSQVLQFAKSLLQSGKIEPSRNFEHFEFNIGIKCGKEMVSLGNNGLGPEGAARLR